MLLLLGFFCREVLLILQVGGGLLILLELLLALVEKTLLLGEFLLPLAPRSFLLLLDLCGVEDCAGAGFRGRRHWTKIRHRGTEPWDCTMIGHAGEASPTISSGGVGGTPNDELCWVAGCGAQLVNAGDVGSGLVMDRYVS